MNMKFYIRGLGAGLIFSSAVLMITGAVTGTSQQEPSQEQTTSSVIAYTTAAVTTEAETETRTTVAETQTASKAEPETTAAVTQPETTQAASQPEESRPSVGEDGMAHVTFHNVYYATQAAALLQEAGVITDAQEFTSYLSANGYASKIKEGEYSIQQGEAYDVIAKIITQTN